MNCFAHALPHLDDAYLAVGSCLPDWLSACDRKCRVREKNAAKFVSDPDPIVSAIARGVVCHHQDDAWFHKAPEFNKLVLDFSVELRDLFGNERSMRPGFLGHVLIELFLDAWLHAENPGRLEYYYQQVETVDAAKIQDAVNLFATKATDQLVDAIGRFVTERYLFDYSTDEGVIYRLNRVFERIGLDLIGDEVFEWLPGARARVYADAGNLVGEKRQNLRSEQA